MSDFTFLTPEQCFGNDKLDILKKRGTGAAITDFSILLGGLVDRRSNYMHIDSDDSLAGRTGGYWTRSANSYGDVRMVLRDGREGECYGCFRDVGARPALLFSSISSIPTNGESGKRARDGVLEVEYGYYPQSAVTRGLQQELERQFTSGRLTKTGNGYTTDSRKNNAEDDEKFKAQRHEEYEYKGKRYIRVKANSCFFDGEDFKLSNGESYSNGDQVWVEVEPIKWLVSERDKLMLAEKIIFAGVEFKRERDYHTGDFWKTVIKQFIDYCWERDIEQVNKQVRSKRKN